MIYPRASAFLKVKYFRQLCKFSTSPAGVVEQLKNRKLIKISGSEVSDFLQGLITNDMKHLENSFGSMYTMFLNVRGRVLYDTIIYRTSEQNVYLIECDSDVVDSLQKHLKMYRVRRKIDITSLEKDLNIWVNFYPNVNENDINIKRSVKSLEGQTVPCSLLNETNPKTSVEITNVIENNTLLVYHDPRLSELGSRIITSSDISLETLKTKLSLFDHLEPSENSNYKLLRYRLGIAEGIVELAPGSCLPLECNCDYLHGVSFHKGCYIGQELTARSYHTGVIRKRLMPIIFNSEFDKKPNHDEIVRSTDDPKSKIGKLKGVEKNLGIGILRIAQALQAKALKIGEVDGVATKPYWWPIEAPKDIASIQKSAN